VDVEPDLLGASPELPNRIRTTFSARDDIDECAHVRIGRALHGFEVEVELADGRTAARRVRRVDDVIATLEALLLVPAKTTALLTDEPEREALGVPVEAGGDLPSLRSRPLPRAEAKAALLEKASPISDPGARDEHWGIELSLLAGSRIGDGQTCVGVGAISLLDLHGWLLGFEGRADNYAPIDGTPYPALQLAVLGGYRFRFATTSLDFMAGPAIAVQDESATTSVQGTASTTASAQVHDDTSGTVPRLLLASHMNFAARSVFRGFVGLEGELGRAGSSETRVGPSAPHLPMWMVGIALGATVGTR
jgi:hypothetical protein